MRHRKVKNLEERIEASKSYLVENAKDNKGKWREFFGNDGRLYLELGCGKGKFLNAKAVDDPEASFIGIEGLDAVMIRGLERSCDLGIANIRFVMDFVAAISPDTLQMTKLYPEGNAEARFKMRAVKRILFYCNKDGLFSINIIRGVHDREASYDDSAERRELEETAKMLFG